MLYELAISPLARDEIIEAFDWYESIRKNLGNELLSELEAVLVSSYKTLKLISCIESL